MYVRVGTVKSDTLIRLSEAWSFHGLSGKDVRLVGLLPAKADESEGARYALRDLIWQKWITIKESWYVDGTTLNAVVHFKEKPIWEYFPNRKAQMLEPSRRFESMDTTPLERVSGGIPLMWENPIPRMRDDEKPFMGGLPYPTEWWLPTHERDLALVKRLYVTQRVQSKEADDKFQEFFSGSATALVIFGDCGIGKSWYAAHTLTNSRPPDSDFVCVDLATNPRGEELIHSIHRTLGTFLDNAINQNPEINTFDALAHHLHPKVAPLFGGDFDPKGKREREVMQRAYEELVFSPAHLADYNEARIGYYDNVGKTLFVLVDNVDSYPTDEQMEVFELIQRTLAGHRGVKVVVSVRPTSTMLIERLHGTLDFVHLGLHLNSPDVKEVLRRRLGTNYKGKQLDLKRPLPGDGESWNGLLSRYLNSRGATIIMDLCSNESGPFNRASTYTIATERQRYDVRHYVRLFRRVLQSDAMLSFDNFGREYYIVHSLLLRPGEAFGEEGAFLYNLFDNDDPEVSGNALVRYRVLEYFMLGTDVGDLFDVYFTALGPKRRVARAVLEAFIRAGYVTPKYENVEGQRVMRSAHISTAGRQHFALVRNLWYGICIKTGMYVERDMIKTGNEARREASQYVASDQILSFYAKRGWVSDDDLIRFLGHQEQLEKMRIGQFEEDNKALSAQIAGLVEHITWPSYILGESFEHQKEMIRRKAERERPTKFSGE